MTALAWQTMLLLGLAYLLGCWLACLLRRMVGSAQDNRVAAPAVAAATGAAVTTAARQSAPGPRVATEPSRLPPLNAPIPGAPVPTAPVRDAFRRADTLEPVAAQPTPPAAQPGPTATAATAVTPAPEPVTTEATVSRFERALTSAPAAGTPARGETLPPLSSANAAVAAAAAAAASAMPREARPVSTEATSMRPLPSGEPVGGKLPSAPVEGIASPGEADDLKRIRTIDQGLEAALYRAGIRRFRDIAAWKPEDVSRISKDLGFKGRIEQENWIEQAQILARGEQTYYSSRLARGEQASARPVEDEGERAHPPAVQPAPKPVAVSVAVPVEPKIEAPASMAPVPPPAAAPVPAKPSAVGVLPAADAAMSAATAAAAVVAAAAAKPVASARDIASTVVEARSAPPAPIPLPAGAVPSKAAPVPPGPAAAPANPQRSGVEAAAAAAAALAAAAAAAAKPVVAAPTEPVREPAVSDQAAFANRSSSVPAASATTVSTPVSASVGAAVGSTRDGLQRIGGVTPEIEKLLNVQGITRYSQIAQWGKTDVEKFDRLLGYQGRIQRENWIEQAQILARGGSTNYSREHDRRTAVALAPAAAGSTTTSAMPRVTAPSVRTPEPDVPPPTSPAAAIQQSAPATSSAAATAIASAAAAAAASLAAGRSASEASEAGVSSSARPSRLADAIRDNEMRPADGTGSAAGLRPSNDLSRLRSVRSEGLRGAGSAALPGAPRSAELHDLKRIRGIGVLIEKKLNSMGVSRYEQIAEWTTADIEKVSHALDFKGRIERENWVEQARILASGGQTEFSRRADRGDGGTPG